MLHVLVITSCVYIMYCALITSSTSMCDPLKTARCSGIAASTAIRGNVEAARYSLLNIHTLLCYLTHSNISVVKPSRISKLPKYLTTC